MHTGASFRSAPRSYFRMIPRLYVELIAYECATSARCRSRTLDRFPRRRLTHPSPTMPTPITAENKSRNEFTAPRAPCGRGSRTGQAAHLLQSIQNHQFTVVYQPQVELATGKIVGVEALIRKKGPGGKLITPDHFIPRYEREGIIRHIDLYVFEVLCAQLKKWHDRGDRLRGSVNFSRVTLMETNIVKTLQNVCGQYGVAPEDVTVEITESVSKVENAALNALINTFHAAGFSISLDDFGTAYSNLSILGELDFTELKIDKSMLQDLTGNKKKQALVKNVILI